MIRTGAQLFIDERSAKKLVKSLMATLSYISEDMVLISYPSEPLFPMAIRSLLYKLPDKKIFVLQWKGFLTRVPIVFIFEDKKLKNKYIFIMGMLECY